LAREHTELDDDAVLALLHMAKDLFGEIEIFGDKEFIARAKKVAEDNGIDISIREDNQDELKLPPGHQPPRPRS